MATRVNIINLNKFENEGYYGKLTDLFSRNPLSTSRISLVVIVGIAFRLAYNPGMGSFPNLIENNDFENC